MRTASEYNEEIERLNDEGYKMSAELEWYKRFHDYIKRSTFIDGEDYIEVCNSLCSEDDR